MYEIIDNNGTIYSGTYEEMITVWDEILTDNPNDIQFDGDLKLIHVLNIYR